MEDRPKDLKLHPITQIDGVEKSTMYEGKWVVNLNVDGVLRNRWFVSEKQARSVDRCRRKEKSFCVLDHANERGPRFVFASDNADWLIETFKASPLAQSSQQPQLESDDLPF